MAGTGRSALDDVIARGEIAQFSFFPLVELLHRLENVDPESDQDIHPEQERVRFAATASLGFHPGDIVSLRQDDSGLHHLEVAFLGLHGSQSPMPGYYLDELAWEYAWQEPRLGLFLDFFHHRLLTLLHRIWRKYRYHVRFQDDGRDGFSRQMFALVGLGNEAVRDSLPVNRAKMLSYAGMLASPSRSPEVISGLVMHCFDLESVEVDDWQMRKVAVCEEQQNRLGQSGVGLGQDFISGERVNDCAGKFVLKINNLSFRDFLRFLPDGDQHQPLVRFMSFILRDQLAWDLSLGFGHQQANGMRLDSHQGASLGWSSFLGTPPERARVRICVQE